jgi:hypothetical protein
MGYGGVGDGQHSAEAVTDQVRGRLPLVEQPLSRDPVILERLSHADDRGTLGPEDGVPRRERVA